MQRLAIVIGLVIVPALAVARPKPTIAIAPIEGDGAKDVEKALVEVMADDHEVVRPKDVKAAMAKLRLSGELDGGDAERLQKKVDATIVVQGWVTKKEGRAKSLRLGVSVGDKKKSFSLEYKSAKSEKFKTALHDELVKRIAAIEEDVAEDKKQKRLADEEDDRKKKAADEEDRKKKVAADDNRKRKKRSDAEDGDADGDGAKKPKKKKVAAADEDDGSGKVRKKRKKRDDDPIEDEATAKQRAQAAGRVMVRVDGGLSFGVRRLTYTSDTPPPRVGTASGGARIEGELYPWADDPKAASAGFGLAGEYDKTFGLGIEIPNGGPTVPIDKQHLSIGARYRFGVGEASTIALGTDYVKRKYVADRSGLTQPNDLDAPDVDYSALGPGIGFRTPVAPTAAFFGGARALLIFNTGPIQDKASYGAATVYGIELATGVDIALGPGWALRFAAELSQINFKFKGNGALADARNVTAATDRDIGAAATLAMKY